MYAYISPRLRKTIDINDDNPIDPVELAQKIDINGAFILDVNNGWNGVNFYGFAPHDLNDQQISWKAKSHLLMAIDEDIV